MAEQIWLAETTSTNAWLKEHATLPHGTVCATLCQTAGRGRLGRTWDGAPGKMLALSVLLHGKVQPGLAVACAPAVASALTEATGIEFAWKWPNDIVCGGRKVCGILCETAVCGDAVATVIGVGVNLTQTQEEFARAGLPYAASLYTLCGCAVDAHRLADGIVRQLLPLAKRLAESGFAPFIAAYERGCVTIGKAVSVRDTDGSVRLQGTARAVAPDGALLVTATTGEEVRCDAGEVSVRGLYGYYDT